MPNKSTNKGAKGKECVNYIPPAIVSFRKHIWKYNSSLQMASFGINI
jgi:hypothetical protein